MNRVSGKRSAGRRVALWGAAGAVVAGLGLGGGAARAADAGGEQKSAAHYEALIERLAQQNRALQERMEKVEAGQRQAEVSQAKLEQDVVDATVKSVLGDAERRSQLLADNVGFTAGYDKGFFIKSDDGNFLLKPAAVFQFRYVANFSDDSDGGEDTAEGFEIRRARFRFDGNVINQDLTYSFVWDTNRSGGGVTLLDAWAQYRFAKNWAVKLGQFKESWSHEKDVGFTSQLAVDRTLVDTVLGGNLTDRVQGVSFVYGGTKENPLRAEVAYHDGANSKNTDFRDFVPGATPTAAPVVDVDFGVGGRVEYKAFGDWSNYRDFTAKGTKEDLLVVGAGLDFTQRGDLDTTLSTVDAQFETSTGWNFYGAVVADFTDTGAGNRTDFGFVAQGGYLIAPAWEAFARWDLVLLDDDFVGDDDAFNEFTVGVNYFLGKDGSALHRAKVTVDASYLPDGAPSNQTGIGVLAGDEDQFVVRAQFQLLL